jgi:restriction endonuclease Mrr
MIPDYQTLMRPVLECAASGGEVKISDVVEMLAKKLGLTAEERAAILPSGKQTRFANRPSRLSDPAKLQVPETRRELERQWLANAESLRSLGKTALADQTRQFVRNLPPAKMEREWLMAGLLERGRIRRVQELEMRR